MAALPINNKIRHRQLRLLLAGLFAAMVVIFLISMTQGIYPLSLHEIFQIIGSLPGFSTIGLYDETIFPMPADNITHIFFTVDSASILRWSARKKARLMAVWPA
ncbi:MAG: hypothetical protein LUE06_10255 [Oscillospiraceae bacterium]|nr:hypothetical protein [Oscillospiraceae bacterium]